MISNYYTFLSLVSIFESALKGKQVREVYSQEADELAIAFHDDPRQLVFLCRPDISAAYLHDGRTRARRNSVDLLDGCRNARLEDVSLVPTDRVMKFSLDTGATIAAVLYGSGANVFLLGKEGKVLDSFKNPKKLRGSTLRIPERELPDGFVALREACSAGEGKSVVSALRKSFPAMGGTLALESATRAGFEASAKTDTIDPSSLAALESAVRSVQQDLASPSPRVYVSPDGAPAFFSLVPLHIAEGMKEERFSDINRAIRFFLAGRGAQTENAREKGAVVSPLEQQLEKGKRALRAIQAEAREAERAAGYEKFGSALMADLPGITRGLKAFETEIDGETVTIPLDPALTPVANARRYFEKAKRAKAAADETSRRVKDLTAKIARTEELLAQARNLPPGTEGEDFIHEHAVDFEKVGLGPRAMEKEKLPFRVFTVDGGFEVWAGKNSANNDLLTLRYAKPDDLWFHARGGSGSHVVLKVRSGKGEPGKKAREQAAGIAAYYSKMKNSGTVAVAMTEKRFVRKPRGSAPGAVVLEREKVIFIHPALPRESTDQGD